MIASAFLGAIVVILSAIGVVPLKRLEKFLIESLLKAIPFSVVLLASEIKSKETQSAKVAIFKLESFFKLPETKPLLCLRSIIIEADFVVSEVSNNFLSSDVTF